MRGAWIAAGLCAVAIAFVIVFVVTDRGGETPSQAPKIGRAPSPASQLPRSLRGAVFGLQLHVRSVRCRNVSSVHGVTADRKCTVELRPDGRRTFIKRHGGEWMGVG